MQKKKNSLFRTDLRPALIASALIGLALLVCFTVITLIPNVRLPIYGAAICGVYLLAVGCILIPYLVRYRRVSAANEAAELMTTEVSDMFRYVVDIPYAIIAPDGMVKIVSGALQDI